MLTATSGEEALELMSKEKVDVLVSDHAMSTMTGLELMERVRDRHPDCARMLLTGQVDMSTTIAAINGGAVSRFLTKPWNEPELKVTIKLALSALELQRENRRLIAMARRQERLLQGAAARELQRGRAREAHRVFVIDEDVALEPS